LENFVGRAFSDPEFWRISKASSTAMDSGVQQPLAERFTRSAMESESGRSASAAVERGSTASASGAAVRSCLSGGAKGERHWRARRCALLVPIPTPLTEPKPNVVRMCSRPLEYPGMAGACRMPRRPPRERTKCGT